MSDVQNAFRRLLERAARAGFVPHGGTTPREAVQPLTVSLAGTDEPEAQHLAELADLVERCAYAEQGTPSDEQHAVRLCNAICDLIPELKPPRQPWWSKFLEKLPYVLGGLLVILVAVLVLQSGYSLSGSSFSFRSAPPTAAVSTNASSAWRSSTMSESAQVSAHKSVWSSPARSVTWQSMQTETTLHESDGRARGTVNLDNDTGTDGVFTNAVDPFTPPLGWTHRLNIYDSVDAEYQFQRPIMSTRGAEGTRFADGETYFAEVDVTVQSDRPVAVPSPGPDTIVTSVQADPVMDVSFTLDVGDGLYVTCPKRGAVHLTYTCSVHHQTYESAPLPDTSFIAQPIAIPANVRIDAQWVISTIGELPGPTYDATVRRLHAYFAGFSVAPINPGERRANDYLTIAMARKGVCRHRARCFFITASALGVPTRLVENRCHSFCEVMLPDGSWRRLEFRLGDEEGPPGLDPSQLDYAHDEPLTAGQVFLLALIPFGLLAVPLFFAWRMRHNRLMYLGMRGAIPSRAAKRAERDNAMRQMVISTNLRALTLAEVGAENREVPLAIRRRLETLSQSSRTTGDAFELQRIYWDCMHIMRWIHRKDQH